MYNYNTFAKEITMAKFDNYGGKCDFLPVETGKFSGPNDKQGGPIDPYGDMAKKGKSDMDMNAGSAFAVKDFTKVEAMGTEAPKKGTSGQKNSNTGDHFKVSTDVEPMGTEAGKSTSYQSRH